MISSVVLWFSLDW